ncbi:amidohydrolase family protein [Nocardia sp. NPDC052566]|uniref:amidohydrolase family protein n=1 Tax=Nocardia sp. NPDC052566 TaxID=3364330 RepID=UPI0037C85B6A
MREIDRRQVLALAAGGALTAFTGVPLAGGGTAAAEPGEPAPVTVLSGATVIDGTGAPPLSGATVVLAGDRILAVGRFPDLPVPPPIRRIELAGKFIIPGLWDMHTHQAPAEQIFPPLYIAYGVTGIREMWGFAQTHEVRRKADRGELIGPRMVIAGSIIDGPPAKWPGSAVVSTEAEARAEVRRSRSDGADFVKVYSMLTRETFAAIADEASKLGLPFAGHVPHRIPVGEAVGLGQHTVEHLYGMQLSTSARAPELYAEIATMSMDPADPAGFPARRDRLEAEAAATYDPARAAALFDQMIRRGSWQSPTLSVLRRLVTGFVVGPDDPASREMLRYMPKWMSQFWQLSVDPLSAEQQETRRQNFDARLRLIAAMEAAGVGIVAGTDAGNPFVFPGYSLHEELELLVRAGLSPLRALQAATRDAARCVGLEHVSGTVEVGKQADLVVLDANPLDAIGNTRRIHAVITRGRYLSPQDRARILSDVETAAQQQADIPFGGGVGGCCG